MDYDEKETAIKFGQRILFVLYLLMFVIGALMSADVNENITKYAIGCLFFFLAFLMLFFRQGIVKVLVNVYDKYSEDE